jgi:hypothetical protein
MSNSFLKQISKMCKAFFLGCKVKLLPSVNIDSIEKVEKRVLEDEDGS